LKMTWRSGYIQPMRRGFEAENVPERAPKIHPEKPLRVN
jgi:hypothetical protein